MAQESFIICDGCGARHSSKDPQVWLNVVPVVASGTAMQRMQAALGEAAIERLVNTADGGEFCSLRCLGEWALARGALKELDAEVDPT